MKTPYEIHFIVPGQPVAKGRPRVVAVGSSGRAFGGRTTRTYTPGKTKAFEEAVGVLAIAAHAQAGASGPVEGPVGIEIVSVLQRPKDKHRKKDPEGLMLAPVRPDIDNLAKAVLDGLKHVLKDDAQVCEAVFQKRYCEKGGSPRTEVRLWML
jgi:Holliday junction resolvase RusA-like endonuclease